MSETLTIYETATATCPGLTITLSGTTEAEYTALAATTTAYTDGYEAVVAVSYGALYFAVAIDNASTNSVVSVGVDYEAVATAPYGAFLVEGAWGADAAAIDDFTGETYFIPATNTSIATDSAEAVTYSANANDIYGSACDIATGSLASGGSKSYTWYMPLEPDSEPASGETDTGAGDRLNKGEKLFAWGIIGAAATTPSTTCSDDENGLKLKLSAATLVAGSVAFAAALAF
jgi:hypothetical protein